MLSNTLTTTQVSLENVCTWLRKRFPRRISSQNVYDRNESAAARCFLFHSCFLEMALSRVFEKIHEMTSFNFVVFTKELKLSYKGSVTVFGCMLSDFLFRGDKWLDIECRRR